MNFVEQIFQNYQYTIQAFVAIGTILVGFVSLYFARNASRQKLKAFINKASLYEYEGEPYVNVWLRNEGMITVTFQQAAFIWVYCGNEGKEFTLPQSRLDLHAGADWARAVPQRYFIASLNYSLSKSRTLQKRRFCIERRPRLKLLSGGGVNSYKVMIDKDILQSWLEEAKRNPPIKDPPELAACV